MQNIHEKIDALVKSNAVLLFMKGTRDQPQCGFSRQVVDVLNKLVLDFSTVDILADSALREGIKSYSSWPTLPQLYINGEFIGGCDIVLDLYNKGELQKHLKLSKATNSPNILFTPSAIEAFKQATQEQPEESIRISIGANFEHALEFDHPRDEDFEITHSGMSFLIDPYSAVRAANLSIDFVKDQLEPGFAFKNPNEPPAVQELGAQELSSWHEQGKDMLLIDVRPLDEWQLAHIDFATRLEKLSQSDIASLPKNKPIVFHCHYGRRSMRMAQSFRAQGFVNLFNLTGGIDAWSRQVDKTIPLY